MSTCDFWKIPWNVVPIRVADNSNFAQKINDPGVMDKTCLQVNLNRELQ